MSEITEMKKAHEMAPLFTQEFLHGSTLPAMDPTKTTIRTTWQRGEA